MSSSAVFLIGCGENEASPTPDGEQDAGPRDDAAATDGGSDGGELPACEGTPLTQDGVLDLDVKTVKITGAITLDGKPLPTSPTGSVQFVERKTGVAHSFSIKPTFQAVLTPGEYDVGYAPQTECSGSSRSAFPCVAGPLKRGVALLQNGNLDIDIPTVSVSGQVTLNGKTLPNASAGRGSLNWTRKDGGSLGLSLGTSGAKGYNLTLLPGVYGVELAATGTGCSASPSEIPCVGGPLKADVAIQQNGNLDLDIPTVRVTGKVALNNQALPDVATGRGQLVFSRNGGGAGQVSLGTSGAKDFSLTVLAGTYSIAYAPASESQCSSGQVTTMMPCAGARLREGLDFTHNGNVDVNIPSVRVTGAVRYRGATLPDAAQSRGSIAWQRDDGAGMPIALGSTGPKTFSIPLVPGAYSVGYAPNAAECTDDAWAFPCVAGPLTSQLTIGQDGNFDVDIPAIRVTGAITLRGQPLPNQSGARGEVSLALDSAKAGKSGGAAIVSLGSTGPKTYARMLLPGTYSVDFQPRSGCTALTPAGVPCVGGRLKSSATLTSNGNLDIDIPAIAVRGNVTLNGAVMPNASSTRGQVVLGLLDSGQRMESLGLDPSGAASYSATILPGRYVALYQNNPTLCKADSPFPCTSQVVKGCP